MRIKWHPSLNNPSDLEYRVPEVGSKFWMFKWDMSTQHIKSFLSPRLVSVIEHRRENVWYPDIVTSIVVRDELCNEYVVGCFNTFSNRNFKESRKNPAYGFTKKEECVDMYNRYHDAEIRRIKRTIKNLKIMLDTIEL